MCNVKNNWVIYFYVHFKLENLLEYSDNSNPVHALDSNGKNLGAINQGSELLKFGPKNVKITALWRHYFITNGLYLELSNGGC